jgi:ATP-dependent protease HslVU (ClpYQ) peptidase subunit
MSVVAVRVEKNRITIASDSIMVSGYTQLVDKNKYSKLTKVNDMIIGSVGTCEESSLLQVFCNTHKPETETESAIINFFVEFAEWRRGKTGLHPITNSYLLIVNKNVFHIEGFFVQRITNYMAIGAGNDYALSALYLGHSVKKAVEVACELCVYCETPVIEYEIKLK